MSKSQTNLVTQSDESSGPTSAGCGNIGGSNTGSNSHSVVMRRNLARQAGFRHVGSEGTMLNPNLCHENIFMFEGCDVVIGGGGGGGNVPVGTVKRQVESINFNSKPCIVRDSEGSNCCVTTDLEEKGVSGVEGEQPRFYLMNGGDQRISGHRSSSELLGSGGESSVELSSQQQQSIQQQSSPPPPESKSVGSVGDETMKDGGETTVDVSIDDVSTLSRLSGFNRSKKVRKIIMLVWINVTVL